MIITNLISGKDATRAFVSGDFSDKGLTDEISGLTPTELIGIEEWMRFYEKDYDSIGPHLSTINPNDLS